MDCRASRRGGHVSSRRVSSRSGTVRFGRGRRAGIRLRLVLLAGLLLKTGGYGLIRFSIPLFPDTSRAFAPVAIALAVAGILYGGADPRRAARAMGW